MQVNHRHHVNWVSTTMNFLEFEISYKFLNHQNSEEIWRSEIEMQTDAVCKVEPYRALNRMSSCGSLAGALCVVDCQRGMFEACVCIDIVFTIGESRLSPTLSCT